MSHNCGADGPRGRGPSKERWQGERMAFEVTALGAISLVPVRE